MSSADQAIPLIDFSSSQDVEAWQAVDDRVMGGVSASGLVMMEDGSACFRGRVSLENGGGFASVHAELPMGSLTGCRALRLRFMGDGRSYSLRLRQADEFDGISWRCDFGGEAGRWQTVELPLDQFEPVFRGRRLTTVAAMQTRKIHRIGLLAGKERPGEFALRLSRIEGVVE